MTSGFFSAWRPRLALRLHRRCCTTSHRRSGGLAPRLGRLGWLLCLLPSLLPLSAAAQELAPSHAPLAITFHDAIVTALSRSLSIEAARLEIDRAQALMAQARAASLPTLTLGLNYTRLDNDRVLGTGDTQRLVAGANQTSGNLTAAVPLLAPSRWASWLHARDGRRVAEISLDEARRQVAMTAARSCLTVIAQGRLQEVSERALATAQAHADYASQRLAGGLGNRLDAVRADSELQLARGQLAQAQSARQRAREALGLILAADQPLDCREAPSFADADALERELAAVTEGSARQSQVLDDLALFRSDLRLLQARAWASARLIRHGWTDFLPQLQLSFAPFFQDPPSIVQPQLGWQARFDLSWSLFDGGLRYGVRGERWVNYRQIRNSQQLALLQARSEVRAATAALRYAKQAEQATRGAAHATEEASQLSMRAYRAGISNNLAVIDAERRARDAATAATQAEDAARQARLELLIAAGRFPKTPATLD